MPALPEQIATLLMRGMITLSGLLIALFSWIAAEQLKDIKDTQKDIWTAIGAVNATANGADRNIARIEQKVDDVAARVNRLEKQSR